MSGVVNRYPADIRPADREIRKSKTPEMKGIRESLPCTGQVTMTSNGTVAVTVVATVDRERFGMTMNKMGMIKGLATATVTAIFVRNS